MASVQLYLSSYNVITVAVLSVFQKQWRTTKILQASIPPHLAHARNFSVTRVIVVVTNSPLTVRPHCDGIMHVNILC